jgi:prepilin-type N-terminal cleavage/methylation domain-containing protein
MKRSGNAGFTLTELAVALVIISLLVGSAFAMFQAMTGQVERRESIDRLAQLRESITGFALTSGRIPAYAPAPGSDELSALLPGAFDFWGRKLVYLYDPELARTDVDRVICAKKTTNLVARRCEDSACATYSDQRNVAFIVFSTGKNLRNQTDASGTPRIEINPPSYSGPVGGFGAANLKRVTLFATGLQVGDFNTPALNPEQNDDLVSVVTLEELRQKLQCQGLPLRIINSDLPVGANGAPYNASIFADGGVPVAVAGRYRWCVESTTTLSQFALTTVTNATSVIVTPRAIGACAPLSEGSWTQGDTLNIKASGGGNVVSGAQTYDLKVFVRDNQNADPAPTPANDPDDSSASRSFVIGINGS